MLISIIKRVIRRITHAKSIEAYNELLADPRWHEKRLLILRRDHYRCTECGKSGKLQVHHTYYKRGEHLMPWEYPDDSLITLCPYCHYKWHMLHDHIVKLSAVLLGKHSR